jgi:hypothetical protein
MSGGPDRGAEHSAGPRRYTGPSWKNHPTQINDRPTRGIGIKEPIRGHGLHRLRGELARKMPRPNPAMAEYSFRALAIV